jgi:hypothetical protein
MLQRAAVNGVDLEFELCGAGEPVVLIHWGVGAKWAEPLLEQQALTSRSTTTGLASPAAAR